MKRLQLFCIALFVFSLFPFLDAAHAEFEGYWEQTSVTVSTMPMMARKGADTTEQVVYFKPGMMKTVNREDGKTTIIRLDKELMWHVDPVESTYTEITFAEMEQTSAAMKEEMAKAKAKMSEEAKDMSPEEKKMMESLMGSKMAEMMGSGGDITLSLTRTGEKEKIGGYQCERVIMTLNGDPLVDMWVTDTYDLGGELFKLYKKMNIFQYDPTEELEKFKGFPMKTVSSMDMGMGAVTSTMTVTKVVKSSVKDSEFDLPKGLQKRESGLRKPR